MQTDSSTHQLASPADQVIEQMHRIMHLYRANQYTLLKEEACELSHMEFKVLNYFWRHPQTTQKDLVKHSGRDKSQLTRLMNGLKEKQLIETEADPVDRRVVRISLSAQGEAVHHRVHALGRRLAEQALLGLSDAESDQLLQLLAKVRRNLSAD